jgi:hypothetical protein
MVSVTTRNLELQVVVREALRAALRQVRLQAIPGHRLRTVVVECCQAALKLSLLRGRERDIQVRKAVPKLLDEAQAILWR